MSYSTWPTTLPQIPLNTSYGRTKDSGILRSSIEGTPIQRLRYTGTVTNDSVTFTLTRSQKATLDAFYFTTLVGGVLAFTFPDSITGDTIVARFSDNTPSYSPNGDNFNVSFKLEIMP